MPAPTPEFQTSANYINGLARALKKLGHFDAVIAICSPDVVLMLREPTARAWWGAEAAVGMTLAIAKVGGVDLLKRVGHLAVFESLLPVLRPFVSVLLALSGPSPATLFARYGQLTQAAVKNVHFDWKPSGAHAGTLIVEYPSPVPPEYLALWSGAFEYVYEVTKARPGPTQATHEGARLRFDVNWS